MGPTTLKLPRRLSSDTHPACLRRPFRLTPERTAKAGRVDMNEIAFGSRSVVIPTGTSPAEIWIEIPRRFPWSEAKPSLESSTWPCPQSYSRILILAPECQNPHGHVEDSKSVEPESTPRRAIIIIRYRNPSRHCTPSGIPVTPYSFLTRRLFLICFKAAMAAWRVAASGFFVATVNSGIASFARGPNSASVRIA